MITNLRKICIFSLIAIFAICGWATIADSKSKNSSHEPEIIVVGNPSKLQSSLHDKLPPGYKWVPEINIGVMKRLEVAKKRALKSGEIFVTPDSDFPHIFVMLNQKTDLDSIIDQAREMGKQSVYIFNDETDPEIRVVPLIIDFDKLWSKSIDSLYSWAESLNNFAIAGASAHAYPDSTCTSGRIVYAGTCLSAQWGDDFPDDGKTPGAFYCFHYTSHRCHWYNYGIHIYKNISSPKQHSELPHITFNPEPVSFVSCMKGHYGTNLVKRPIDLTVNFYQTSGETGAAPGSCGGSVCGCGQQPPKTIPRSSEGSVIWLATEDPFCDSAFSSLETARHEVSHTYGYEHPEMDVNLDDVAHCINGGRSDVIKYPPLHTIF